MMIEVVVVVGWEEKEWKGETRKENEECVG